MGRRRRPSGGPWQASPPHVCREPPTRAPAPPLRPPLSRRRTCPRICPSPCRTARLPRCRCRSYDMIHDRTDCSSTYSAICDEDARESTRAVHQLAAELGPPRGVMALVLDDDADVANGATTVFPWSRIYVMVPPPLGDPGL